MTINMQISRIDNSSNANGGGNFNVQNTPNKTSFKGKVWEIKSEKLQSYIEKAGKLSTPANRLFLGATAMAIQPFIDLNNKDVDDGTRKVSCARTIAKIFVGTVTGIFVRKWCIGGMNYFTRTPEDIKKMKEAGKTPSKWSTAMVPSTITHEKFGEAKRLLSKHRNALGSIVALGVMLFTNFLIDAPATRILTNVIVNKIKKSDEKKAEAKGGK